ncbi:MAG: CDP-alcohol phosphatidyltransferase family protein [Methyloceanibacter sp.]|uniref:CDP-alcohol phosphatidyltransferase family protein n=1 Tax=Methyloceanibacter sp. TaxID=1965321 RepID=UPI003EE34D52
MSRRLRAASVHVLTAIGAVLALLALRAVHQADWQMLFVWLGIALFVDAIDGPLARLFEVKAVLPRFSGERLDLIVDYLTYVAIPAFVLTETALLPEWSRLPAAIAVLLSGLFHVSDVDSKTEEGYFVGFPAIWNIVLLYLFVLGLPPYGAFAVVVGLVLLTFVPILFVHPFRVVRLRILSGLVALVWAVAAAVAVANPFPSAFWVKMALLAAAAYFASVGLGRGLRRFHDAAGDGPGPAS